MSKYEAIFKRYEKKYLLSKTQYEELRKRLEGIVVVDKYGKSTISNIYFDTPDSKIIRASLDKPVYKEKLRLRSYGTPNFDDTVFIELKKKYDGIVYKRRVDMELKEAVSYLYNGEKENKSSQILEEINWFLNYYSNIQPAMFIGYERIACYGIKDESLRITYDTNIVWRTEQLELDKGMWGNQLLEDGQVLMEIKIPGAMPLWLSHILNELEIYPTSFSKYGKGYQTLFQSKINSEIEKKNVSWMFREHCFA